MATRSAPAPAPCSPALAPCWLLADNPKLDVRLVSTPRQPHLVIADSQLETTLNAAFLELFTDLTNS